MNSKEGAPGLGIKVTAEEVKHALEAGNKIVVDASSVGNTSILEGLGAVLKGLEARIEAIPAEARNLPHYDGLRKTHEQLSLQLLKTPASGKKKLASQVDKLATLVSNWSNLRAKVLDELSKPLHPKADEIVLPQEEPAISTRAPLEVASTGDSAAINPINTVPPEDVLEAILREDMEINPRDKATLGTEARSMVSEIKALEKDILNLLKNSGKEQAEISDLNHGALQERIKAEDLSHKRDIGQGDLDEIDKIGKQLADLKRSILATPRVVKKSPDTTTVAASSPTSKKAARLTEDSVEQLGNKERPDEEFVERRNQDKLLKAIRKRNSRDRSSSAEDNAGVESSSAASSTDNAPTPKTGTVSASEAAAIAAFDKWEKKGMEERGEKEETPKSAEPSPIVTSETKSAAATPEKTPLEEAKENYENKLRQQMQQEATKRKEKRIYRALGTHRDLREGGLSVKGEKKNKELEKARKIYLDQKETSIRNEVELLRTKLRAEKVDEKKINEAVILERHHLSLLAAAENYQRRKEIGTEVLPPKEQGWIGRSLRNWADLNKKHPLMRYAVAGGLSLVGSTAIIGGGILFGAAAIPAAGMATALFLAPRVAGALVSAGLGAYLSESIRKARAEGGSVAKIFKFKGKEEAFRKKEEELRNINEKKPFKTLDKLERDFRKLQKEKGLYDYKTLRTSMLAALTTGVVIGGASSAAANQLVALEAASVIAGGGGPGGSGETPPSPPGDGVFERFDSNLPDEARIPKETLPGAFPNDKEEAFTPQRPAMPHESFEDNLPEEARRASDNIGSMPDDYMKETDPRKVVEAGAIAGTPIDNGQEGAAQPRRGSDGPRLNEYPESPDEIEKWPEAVPGEPRPDEPQFPARTIGRTIGESPEPPAPNESYPPGSLREDTWDRTRSAIQTPADVNVPEAMVPQKVIHTVTKGENVWKILIGEAKAKGLLEQLPGGKQTHFIDSLKDKLAVLSPEEIKKMGISSGDINKIKVGEKLDLTNLFADKNSIEMSQYEASRLKAGDVANIEKNNAAIAEWRKDNPGRALTDAVISNEILKKPKGLASAASNIGLPEDSRAFSGTEVNDNTAPKPTAEQLETMNKVAIETKATELIDANLGSESSWIPWFNQKGVESSAWANGQNKPVQELLSAQRGSAREMGLTEGDLFKLQKLAENVMTTFGVEPVSGTETLKKLVYRAVTEPSSIPETAKDLIRKAVGAKNAA